VATLDIRWNWLWEVPDLQQRTKLQWCMAGNSKQQFQ